MKLKINSIVKQMDKRYIKILKEQAMTKLKLNGEKLKKWMDSYVKKKKFNGCSLCIEDIDGNSLLDIASGHADKEKTKEFNSLSIVRIFSMTKAIVSACLLQLLSEEKINLQDTLDHYFDNYSNCYALIENAKNVNEIEKIKAPLFINYLIIRLDYHIFLMMT